MYYMTIAETIHVPMSLLTIVIPSLVLVSPRFRPRSNKDMFRIFSARNSQPHFSRYFLLGEKSQTLRFMFYTAALQLNSISVLRNTRRQLHEDMVDGAAM